MAGSLGGDRTGSMRGEQVRARRARIEEIRELAREYEHESASLSSDKHPSSAPIPEGGIFWVAEGASGDSTLGYAAGSLRPEGLTVGPVYVRPRERRRGVGQALLQAIQRWARETGIPVVEVSVPANDEVGLSLLKSAGYVPRRILFSLAGPRMGERDKSPETSDGNLSHELEW
ncbi:MAG: GNAT family N-acetyltransferase [Actinomycetota bacterium]|nr:GNAT family N-acetyltransferase [Actinomycetota bacterium]